MLLYKSHRFINLLIINIYLQMIKYFKKGCEFNWSDGCFAAGMKLRYHSNSITDVEERNKCLCEASVIMITY